MATIDTKTGLVLNLPLNEIVSGKAKDLSTNNVQATVSGATVVPDDTFGSCLSFDGSNDSIDCGRGSFQIQGSAARTILCWAKAEAFNHGGLFQAGPLGPTGQDFSLRTTNTDNLWRAQFWGTADQDATLANSKNTWNHYALVYDGTTAKLYYNGVLATTKTVALNTGAHNLIIGKWATYHFQGKMAHTRVYDRALSEAQIKQIMAENRNAQAAFKVEYPIDFSLIDDEERNVLYISEATVLNNCQVEVYNRSDQNLSILKKTGTPSASNHHLELKFKPNAFDAATFGSNKQYVNVKGLPDNWVVGNATKDNETGTISLYLLYSGSTDFVFNAGSNFAFTIEYKSAGSEGGARGTTIELLYKGIAYQSDTTTPLTGTRIKPADIVNQRGKKNIPLYVGIQGSNTILNDASAATAASGTASNLTLRIVNTLEQGNLAFTTGAIDTNKNTKFTLLFDDPIGDDWDLASIDQLNAISVTTTRGTVNKNVRVSGSGASVTKTTQGKAPTFEITPNISSLAPGDTIDLNLTNIRSNTASGFANIYLKYEDVPGYWDGQFVVQVEKSPIVHKAVNGKKNVGIGVLPDGNNRLKVDGNVDIKGNLKVQKPYVQTAAQKFTLGGSTTQWYPVIFTDNGWNEGPLQLDISRASTHEDRNWFGALEAQIECHSTSYGHGADFWSIKVSQSQKKFIAGFTNNYKSAQHVIWLLGGSSYYWRSNHPVTLADSNAQAKTLTGYSYAIKTSVDDAFNANSYEITNRGGALTFKDSKVGIGTLNPTTDSLEIHKNWHDSSTDSWGGGLKLVGNAPTVSFWENDNGNHRWMWHMSNDIMNLYRRPAGGGWQRHLVVKNNGSLGIGAGEPQAGLSVGISAGKETHPDSSMHLTNDCILFGGNNNGKEVNSAQISAGKHHANSLNIVGMSDANRANRKVDIWAEGGMRVYGRAAIGTQDTSKGILQVAGGAWRSLGGYGFLNRDGAGNYHAHANIHYSIYADNRIACPEFNAFSDLRIKDVMGTSDAQKDLATLEKLEIVDYQYKDKLTKGDKHYKKVIGQQVAEVYPQVVDKVKGEVVPDIMQKASMSKGIITLANHGLSVSDEVKVIWSDKDKEEEVKDLFYRVKSVSAESFELDTEESIDEVFVYGRKVNDFHVVDYEGIAMLNVSATQALAQENRALKAEVQGLKKEIVEIKAALKG